MKVKGDPEADVEFDFAEIMGALRRLGRRMPETGPMNDADREARIAQLRRETQGWRA